MELSVLLNSMKALPQQEMDRQGVSADKALESGSKEALMSFDQAMKASSEKKLPESLSQGQMTDPSEDVVSEEDIEAIIAWLSASEPGAALNEKSEQGQRLLMDSWNESRQSGLSARDFMLRLSKEDQSLLQKAMNQSLEVKEVKSKPVDQMLFHQMQQVRELSQKVSSKMVEMDDIVQLAKSAKAEGLGRSANDEMASLREKLGDRNPVLAQEQKSAGSLRDLTSGLFVQKSLDGQLGSNLMQTHQSAQQFMLNSSQSQPLLANHVRTNLFEDMQGQITKFVSQQEGGEIHLKLRPGNLGDVRIQVQVHNGGLRLNLQAEKAMGEQALRSQVHELKAQLVSAGIKLEDLQISQSSRASASSQEQNQEGRQFAQKDSQDGSRSGHNRESPEDQAHQQPKRSYEELFDEKSVA